MGVINAIMATRIGNEAVSGIGMVDSVNNIFVSFISALAIGSTVVTAHYMGRKEISMANEAARQGLYSGLAITIFITLLITFIRRPLILFLFGTAEAPVIEYALIYLGITVFSYPFIAITSIVCGILRGAGDTRTPMKITIFMNFLNIVFSYVLIYGINMKFGSITIYLKGHGVTGAALGISAARFIGALLSLFVLKRGSGPILVSNLFKIFDFKLLFHVQKSIFNIGIPASVESLLFQGGRLITQIFIVSMGTLAITTNYVATSVFSLINIPGSALSLAATTLVGQAMGRGEKDEAQNLLIYLIKLTTVSLIILCALSYPLAPMMASLYSESSEVIKTAAEILRLNAVVMPFIWSFAFIGPAGLRGAGDARFTMIVSVASMWLFRITFGFILGKPMGLGVMGIWIGMYVDWLFRSIVYTIRIKRGKWKDHTVIFASRNL